MIKYTNAKKIFEELVKKLPEVFRASLLVKPTYNSRFCNYKLILYTELQFQVLIFFIENSEPILRRNKLKLFETFESTQYGIKYFLFKYFGIT